MEPALFSNECEMSAFFLRRTRLVWFVINYQNLINNKKTMIFSFFSCILYFHRLD